MIRLAILLLAIPACASVQDARGCWQPQPAGGHRLQTQGEPVRGLCPTRAEAIAHAAMGERFDAAGDAWGRAREMRAWVAQ